MKMLTEAEVDQQYADEALDEARDVVNGLEIRMQQIRGNTLDPVEAASLLAMDAANLRLKAKAVNIPSCSGKGSNEPARIRTASRSSSISQVERCFLLGGKGRLPDCTKAPLDNTAASE